MSFDPYAVLRRTLERERSLCWNLKEVLVALDEAPVGPTTAILPRWQVERIEDAIEQSEQEAHDIMVALGELDVNDHD